MSDVSRDSDTIYTRVQEYVNNVQDEINMEIIVGPLETGICCNTVHLACS